MLNPWLWLAVIAITGGLTTLGIWSLRRQRNCPACKTAMISLGTPEGRSYEVLACPACATAVTLAVGHRARLSWCPTCKQRSLETPCFRHPDPQGALVVEVREHCHLCPHDTEIVVDAPAPPRGIVVPFPDRPDRNRRAGGRR